MSPSGGLTTVVLPFRMWSPREQQAVFQQHQAHMVGGVAGGVNHLQRVLFRRLACASASSS